MFIINCPTCEAQQLVTNKNIESVHRTSEGMVGYVRCPGGHTVLHQFAMAYPKPKPPAAVLALREAQAIEAAGQVEDEAVTAELHLAS